MKLLPVGTKIRHGIHTRLLGEIVSNDDYFWWFQALPKCYRIIWNEPWYAASVLFSLEDFFFLAENELDVLDEKFQPLLRNRTCSYCEGSKGFKTDTYGWLVCPVCKGAGVVYGTGVRRQ